MNSWYLNPGAWTYGACAVAYAWLAFKLVAQWHPGGKPAMLLAMALGSSAAAVASVAFAVQLTVGLGWVAAVLDFARAGLTLGFLLAFLGSRREGASARQRGRDIAPLLGLAIVLLLAWLLVGVRPPRVLDPNAVSRHIGFGSALGVAVFGLMLVEECYRRTPVSARWQVRPLLLGLGGILAFDLVLYSDALLFGVLDFDLWVARGFAQALTVPLILVTLNRCRDWSFELSVSRGVVAGSTTLALTGGYLLLVAGAGFLLKEIGGSWGRALQSVLLFAAVLAMVVIGLSATFRAKVRVLVSKHFFSYRYDYREEWLRLTNTLVSGPAARPWSACLDALGNLVESPGGALWFRSAEGGYRQVERSGFPASTQLLPDDASLPAFLTRTGWVLDVSDVLRRSSAFPGLSLPADIVNVRDAWLIVPLMTARDLVGFVVLTTPRVAVDLDWEVRDLLKAAGRQAAGYVAYTQATEALLEAQKFDAFHRMSTFVVHDLKNLIAQLQLLLSNAERHRDNPEFQRDMMRTIEHVVGRMHQLTLQLRPEASARDRPQPVDVGAIVRRVQTLRLGGRDGLVVDVEEGAFAWAHDDLLERVIAHLVQNAFEASRHPGQEVTVRVRCSVEMVTIEVTDRGKGMTAEFIRERLFRPFQTTKESGMGIGVFECQQYVQQMGGRIDVKSAPGEGTQITVRLPAVTPSRMGAAA